MADDETSVIARSARRAAPNRATRRRALQVMGGAVASALVGRPALGATSAGSPASLTVREGESLQAAVDRAAPGATVAVEPGTRVGTVTIDKPLTLVGLAGFRDTVLAADRSRFRWSGLPREQYRVGAVNVVGTHDVTISGFTFLDALEGVWISASRRVTIVDCMSCAHTSSGFYVWGSQDVTIARCQGEDSAVGMYQGGSVDVSIVDSVFTRNRGGTIPHLDDQEYAGTGILIGNFSRGCRVIGNDVHGNTDWGLGVSLGVSKVTVRGNRFADNVVGVFAGASGLSVHRNDIVGNSSFGVEAATQCDARWNWWGDPSGPAGAGPGEGDPVTPAVAIDPWLERPVAAGHGISARP
jgi:nitrous oxidase accessory protein NosD